MRQAVLSRKDWMIISIMLNVGIFAFLLSTVMPVQHQSIVAPYRPATAEERQQYEIDHLTDLLLAQQASK